MQADRVFKLFRTGFIGKASPVHFFWGSFDLAVTRFSGRRAPLHPGGVPGLPDAVTREAYSHEVSSAGFWPGNEAFPRAAFYSYAYPEPAGFRDRPVDARRRSMRRSASSSCPTMRSRKRADPDALLLDFLSTTYAAAAETGRLGPRRAGMPVRRSRTGAADLTRASYGARSGSVDANPREEGRTLPDIERKRKLLWRGASDVVKVRIPSLSNLSSQAPPESGLSFSPSRSLG